MAVEFFCPYCGAKLKVPDEYAGTEGACKACGKTVVAPAAGEFAALPRASWAAAAPASVPAPTRPGERGEAFLTWSALPALQDLVREGCVSSSSKTLLIWGAINTVGWLVFGRENVEFFSRIGEDGLGALLVGYGGLLIGLAMLVFGAAGFATRAEATVALDGLMLAVVGLYNISSDFIAMAVVSSHGYTLEPGRFWIILGVFQLGWAAREFARYHKIKAWPRNDTLSDELRELRKRLDQLKRVAPGGSANTVKASRLFVGIANQKVQYCGQLSDDWLIMVANGCDDLVAVSRNQVLPSSFGKNGTANLVTEAGPVALQFPALSLLAVKSWCGAPVTAQDVDYLRTSGTATKALVEPYLSSPDPELRKAAERAYRKAKQ